MKNKESFDLQDHIETMNAVRTRFSRNDGYSIDLNETTCSNSPEHSAKEIEWVETDEIENIGDYWEGRVITPELKQVFEVISSESGKPFDEIVEAFRNQKYGFVYGLCTIRQRLLALGNKFIGEKSYEILSPLIQDLNGKLG